MLTIAGIAAQLTELMLAVLLAPLFTGWVNMCRAWMQNKSAPPLLTPYRVLLKLFNKEPVLAQNASPLFRITPYIIFGCMCLAAAIVPTLDINLPFNAAADAIALVGLFALARVFMSLAAMDIGTAFGTLGARREMMIGFLAEPDVGGGVAPPVTTDARQGTHLGPICPKCSQPGLVKEAGCLACVHCGWSKCG